jgi:hypothetical protein
LKTNVDTIHPLSPTIPSVQQIGEEDNNQVKSEQESSKINPVQGLKLAIERFGSTKVPQRSQTMKHYARAKSDGLFKHQNRTQIHSKYSFSTGDTKKRLTLYFKD